jgi:hypothetical protein
MSKEVAALRRFGTSRRGAVDATERQAVALLPFSELADRAQLQHLLQPALRTRRMNRYTQTKEIPKCR